MTAPDSPEKGRAGHRTRDGHQGRLRRRGRRLGEVALEASMIVFAVIIALTVDQYWESREEVGLAETAIESIRQEILRNQEQLADNRDGNRESARATQAQLRAIRNGDLNAPTPDVDYSFSLVGDDAWETARVTRAIHFMDFALVTQISQVYRIQDFFTRRQDEVVDAVAGFMEGQASGDSNVGGYSTQLLISLQIECQLMVGYDLLLARLEGGDEFDVEAVEEQAGRVCTNDWLNQPPASAEAPTGGS